MINRHAHCFDAILTSQELVVVESMHMGLETVVGAIFDGSAEFVSSAPETKFELHSILEGHPC